MKHHYYICIGWDAYIQMRVSFVTRHGNSWAQPARWKVWKVLGAYVVRIKL